LPNPITQDLLFTDNTYDIGKAGASRPRDVFASRNAVVGGTLGVSGISTFTADLVATGASMSFQDNEGVVLGTGSDATIKYDGTDLVVAPAAVGSGDIVVTAASIEFADSEGVTLGTGKDATLQYDGTDLVIAPAAVGAGDVHVSGGSVEVDDSESFTLGTGKDATIIYDGTDLTISPAAVGSGDLVIAGASAEFADSEGVTLGTGKDATLQYDGTNVSLDTQAVGSGLLIVTGSAAISGVEIDNTATDGDPTLAFTLSGTSKFTMGVDDGDSDKFKIGTTAIGTGTALTIDGSQNISLSSTLGVTGLITSTGGITGGASSHTTGAFSGLVSGTASGAGATFIAANATAQYLQIRNTTAGTAAHSVLYLGNDVDGSGLTLTFFSGSFTTSGKNVQAGALLDNQYAGGLSISASHASGDIRFYSGGTTQRWSMSTEGHLLPGATDTYSIGAEDNLVQFTMMNYLRAYSSTYPINLPNWSQAHTGTDVVWNANGYLYQKSSSARYKENMSPWVVAPDALRSFLVLSPSLWDYKGHKSGAAGFISEDLEALPIRNAYGTNPLINYDKEGRPESNRDYALIGLQHLVLQQHDARLAVLEAKLLAAGV